MAAYRRLRGDLPRPVAAVGALAALTLIPGVALLAPANSVTGPVPDALAGAFRAVTVAGRVGLWVTMASTHAWLTRRADETETPLEPEETVSSATTIQ